MVIRAISRHSEVFDIHDPHPDPNKSPYADFDNYVEKVRRLYDTLDVQYAVWAYPDYSPPRVIEIGKEIEYVLELDESRVIAYVDSSHWSDFLFQDKGTLEELHYHQDPVRRMGSLLIHPPIAPMEVKIKRWLKRVGSDPEKWIVVKEIRY